MGQAANIAISDGTVTRTYSPVRTSGGLVEYVDRSTNTTSAGAGEISISFDQASATRATDRAKIHLADPREDTVDGFIQVKSVPRAHLDLIMPEVMTSADRIAFCTLLQNLISHAVVDDLVEDLDPPY